MSRSRRYTPIGPVDGGKSSCKWFKVQEHQRYRAYVRDRLAHEDYDGIQGWCGKFCNEWNSPRDGKAQWFSYKYWDCNEHVSLWREYYYSRRYTSLGCCNGIYGHWHCKVYYKELMRK